MYFGIPTNPSEYRIRVGQQKKAYRFLSTTNVSPPTGIPGDPLTLASAYNTVRTAEIPMVMQRAIMGISPPQSAKRRIFLVDPFANRPQPPI
jgi:hypothetical protein